MDSSIQLLNNWGLKKLFATVIVVVMNSVPESLSLIGNFIRTKVLPHTETTPITMQSEIKSGKPQGPTMTS